MSSKPVCLIIGAGPGLGYSFAKKWSANGYKVVIVRRSEGWKVGQDAGNTFVDNPFQKIHLCVFHFKIIKFKIILGEISRLTK